MFNVIISFILGVLFASSYLLVYNLGNKKNKSVKIEDIDKEEKEKYKKYQEGFNNMMNYSIDTALGRGEK